MRLTVVGSSGTYPAPTSACSSYLVEHDGFRLLLDLGSGALGPLQAACGLLGPDAVLISHLHGDHYLDLLVYTYVRRHHPAGIAPRLPIYGPSRIAEALTGGGGVEAVDDVYDVHPVDADRTVEIGPFEVDLRRMNHSLETYGSRVSVDGHSVAYSADTAPCETLVDLARDVDVLLCEASFLDGEDNPPGLHLTGSEAAAHATRAGAGRLVLTHLVPWGDEDRTLAGATAGFDGEIAIARPLDTYDI
jgi:ribonuclease BN (tRNA processing enzyme)